MKTNILVIVLFMVTILTFTSIALHQRNAWDKIQDYTPSWVDEKIFLMVVYLFLVTLTLSWITTLERPGTDFRRYAVGNLYLVSVILFYFVIFTMGEDELKSTELMVLSTITLVALVLTILSRQILTIVPFLLYIYFFSIIYEIKNNDE